MIFHQLTNKISITDIIIGLLKHIILRTYIRLPSTRVLILLKHKYYFIIEKLIILFHLVSYNNFTAAHTYGTLIFLYLQDRLVYI